MKADDYFEAIDAPREPYRKPGPGMCGSCGKRPPLEGYQMCRECRIAADLPVPEGGTVKHDCPICGKGFDTAQGVRVHVGRTHADQSAKPKPKCSDLDECKTDPGCTPCGADPCELVPVTKSSVPTTEAKVVGGNRDFKARLARTALEGVDTVAGPRDREYGDPTAMCATVARMWDAYLAHKGSIAIEPFDVPVMMQLVKIARLGSSPMHHDSIVDIIGWALIEAEVAGHE